MKHMKSIEKITQLQKFTESVLELELEIELERVRRMFELFSNGFNNIFH